MATRPLDPDPDPVDAILADPVTRARLIAAVEVAQAEVAAGLCFEVSDEDLDGWLSSLGNAESA